MGWELVHEQPDELFVVDTQYPVIPTLSVAVNVVIGTVSEEEYLGSVNAVTVGGVVTVA